MKSTRGAMAWRNLFYLLALASLNLAGIRSDENENLGSISIFTSQSGYTTTESQTIDDVKSIIGSIGCPAVTLILSGSNSPEKSAEAVGRLNSLMKWGSGRDLEGHQPSAEMTKDWGAWYVDINPEILSTLVDKVRDACGGNAYTKDISTGDFDVLENTLQSASEEAPVVITTRTSSVLALSQWTALRRGGVPSWTMIWISQNDTPVESLDVLSRIERADPPTEVPGSPNDNPNSSDDENKPSEDAPLFAKYIFFSNSHLTIITSLIPVALAFYTAGRLVDTVKATPMCSSK